jgi:hypothetical protein
VAIAASASFAAVMVPRMVRRSGDAGQVARRAVGPGAALGVVVGLIYVNQVLVSVYVSRIHGGDTSFITRYLPEGWFAVASGNPVIDAITRHFPAPELLASTVLRVQAFLELPFVLLAYLTVLRWLDRGWYRRVANSSLVWAAAVSYTMVFCAVEWELRNPYTADDIVIRIVAAIATPLLITRLARRETGLRSPVDSPISASGLVMFAVSAWALGYLVLVVYDTALLYNLAHLRGRLPAAAAALAVLLAVRLIDGRFPAYAAGTGVAVIAAGLRWSLALFFVPALAVRYGVNFGTSLPAAAAGGVILLAAAVHAGQEGLPPRRRVISVAQLSMAGAAGLTVAYLAVRWVSDTFYEATVLRGAVGFLIAAVLVCAATDKYLQASEERSV